MWEFHEIRCRILDQSRSRFHHSGYHFCSDLVRVLVNVLNEGQINEGVYSLILIYQMHICIKRSTQLVEVQGPK